jgi:hypothetical protein
MYTSVTSKAYVPFGTAQYSQAVSMDGANAVNVEATAFAVTGGELTVAVQGSNDLDNWEDVSAAAIIFSGPGADDSGAITGIGFAYVRLGYSVADSGAAIVAAGIETANL